MRNFDLKPLYSSTIGFDRLFSLLDDRAGQESAPGYPPYNIEKTGDSTYRISIAVAGFAAEDLNIEARENTLLVRGAKVQQTHNAQENEDTSFLFRGIAARNFERRFQLADYVNVSGARLENGLLHIELLREVPEAAKPKRIQIATAGEADHHNVLVEPSKIAA